MYCNTQSHLQALPQATDHTTGHAPCEYCSNLPQVGVLLGFRRLFLAPTVWASWLLTAHQRLV